MQATTKIAAVLLLLAPGCASYEPSPARFSTVAVVADAECVIVRAALEAVLAEEPYFTKPAPAPAISYIAVSPYLAADAFGENPHEALKGQAPVNLWRCVGQALVGPRARVMGFTYPQQLRNERIADPHGWVSRPIVERDKATVLLNRGPCYRTTTIELARADADWRLASIRHTVDHVVWSGRHPCDPWP